MRSGLHFLTQILVFGVAVVNSWACFVVKTDSYAYTFYRTPADKTAVVQGVGCVQW